MIFRIILWSIGALLAVTSRVHARTRAQIARDMTVTLAARGGAARSYVFRNRRVSAHAGHDPDAIMILTFASPAAGARILLAEDAVLQIVRGLCTREIELVGMPAHVLWLYEMVFGYVPWRRKRYHVAPHATVAPDLNSKVADRITREPPQAQLDPNWTAAHTQREKMEMWRVGKGELSQGRVPGFAYIVDIPQAATEDSA
jgi:hypothetical protein